MKLIGLMGSKGVGKTTVANYLVENHKYVNKPMAEPLKLALKQLFLLSDEQLDGSLKEEIDLRWNCTPRRLMQFVGTDLLRNHLDEIIPGIGEDIFLRRFQLWYDQELMIDPQLNVVVSDIRFQNEADLIKQNNGIIIWIKRDMIHNDNHISETHVQNIINYDFVIDNNKTLDDLFQKISLNIDNK